MAVTCYGVLQVIFVIILPPVAVFMETGCGCDLLLNIILTLLGWIPGQIHACCVITYCVKDDGVTG